MTDTYQRAYERERQARLHAEKLLDEKTRILYESNVELEKTVESHSRSTHPIRENGVNWTISCGCCP
jgi:hypothetical protein